MFAGRERIAIAEEEVAQGTAEIAAAHAGTRSRDGRVYAAPHPHQSGNIY
jgi:hypothetical protein